MFVAAFEYFWRGLIFAGLGENERAIADLEQALELNPLDYIREEAERLLKSLK